MISNGQGMYSVLRPLHVIDTSELSMLDLLEDFLQLRSIKYSRLDGSTTRPRRTLDTKLVSKYLCCHQPSDTNRFG